MRKCYSCAAVLSAVILNAPSIFGATSTWKGGAGTWETAANWTPSGVPNSNTSNVAIDGATSVVTMNYTDKVSTLALTNAAQLTVQNLGALQLYNGLNFGGGASLNLSTGAISVAQNGQPVSIGGTGSIYFANTDNNGISFTASSGNVGSTLTIGSGVLIHGANGDIGGGYYYSTTGIINQGTIDADGGDIFYVAGGWTNQGTIEATNGTLQLDDVGNNSAGTLSVSTGGTLELGFNCTLATLGKIVQSGGSVDLNGNIDGQNGTLDFNSGSLKNVNMTGEILNANVTFSGGGAFTCQRLSLSNDHLSCPLNMPGALYLSNNITFNNTTLTAGGTIYFPGNVSGPQTISGTGTIVLAPAANSAVIQYFSGGSSPLVTIANGITIHGGPANFDINLVNQGVIDADVSGSTITFDGYTLANSGLVEANAGNIHAIRLNNTGTIAAINGGNFTVYGVVANTGTMLVDSSSSMTFDYGLTLSSGSVLDLVLPSVSKSPLLQVNGNLNLSAGNLSLAVSASNLPIGPELLATYTGTLSGSFNNIPANVSLDYSHPGDIYITVVPEPAMTGLAAAACLTFSKARRRRVMSRNRKLQV